MEHSALEASAPAFSGHPQAAISNSSSSSRAGETDVAHTTSADVCLNPLLVTSRSSVGGRFLCGEEELAENHESTDNDIGGSCIDEKGGDDGEAESGRRKRVQAFQRLRGDSLPSPHIIGEEKTNTSSSNNNNRRNPPSWAKRQLHRSLSLDDLMEYQREFRLAAAGRCNSSSDLTRYQRSEQQPQQQHSDEEPHTTTTTTSTTTRAPPPSSNNGDNNNKQDKLPRHANPTPSKPSPLSQKKSRKSIANSDLDEFKRIFVQSFAVQRHLQDADSDDEVDKNGGGEPQEAQKEKPAAALDSARLSDKLRKLEETKIVGYQWGTRSLRRAILGSDLTRFERSVRTGLLENSRENSSGSLDAAVAPTEDADRKGPCTPPRSSPSPSLLFSGEASSNSSTKGGGSILEEDWGTRSLRKSLSKLGLSDHYPPATAAVPLKPSASRMETIHDDQQSDELPLASPWQDDKVHQTNQFGLKMPRRVTSGEARVTSGGRHPQEKESSVTSATATAKPTATTQQERSCSLNDIGVTPIPLAVANGEPVFEWQLRSPFRRSISSSDIEKYQRHFDAGVLDESFGGLSDSDQEDESESISQELEAIDCQSAHTVATMESTSATRAKLEGGHALMEGSRRTQDTCNSSINDTVPKQPKRGKKKRRSHRRSNSDEPELLMESTTPSISDVAPRKPNRTTSRPKSPPPTANTKLSVRFATNQTTVVEIPMVTEDMKSSLFYTKRDVKRFRMNEHRRQEEQIRAYMEYLNEKDNALDASPSFFD